MNCPDTLQLLSLWARGSISPRELQFLLELIPGSVAGLPDVIVADIYDLAAPDAFVEGEAIRAVLRFIRDLSPPREALDLAHLIGDQIALEVDGSCADWCRIVLPEMSISSGRLDMKSHHFNLSVPARHLELAIDDLLRSPEAKYTCWGDLGFMHVVSRGLDWRFDCLSSSSQHSFGTDSLAILTRFLRERSEETGRIQYWKDEHRAWVDSDCLLISGVCYS